jgi:dolichyl-diphosphooligosaccharide--protein glycosyltransferase
MNVNRLSPGLIIGVLIAVIFGISLLFRIVLPYHQVFNGEWIKFTSIDAYFYQRIIDSTAVNFPHIMSFDPYLLYPGGTPLTDIFFPSWFLSGIIWIIGLGSPTQHLIDVVSVYFPAVIAALTVIPVYFIGKTLFNRWVGVIAAGLIAILPGEWLGRTILGLNDTPAVETLLTTTFMAFAILAVKTARERELTFADLLRRDWSKCARPLVYTALAGLFLGIYLISWTGALLFVFIFALYLVIQFVNDHLRGQSTDYLGIVGFISLLIALLIFFSFAPGAFYLAAMVLAVFVPVVLMVISRLLTFWKIRPLYYPVALAVAGGIVLLVFYGVNPALFRVTLSQFGVFAPSGATAATTIEMQPFLAPSGTFNTAVAWGNFSTSFFLFPWFAFPGVALISLSILFYLFFRRGTASESVLRPVIWVLAILAVIMFMLLASGYGQRVLSLILLVVLFVPLFLPGTDRKQWLLFLVWTLVILYLTLSQRRFAYYLVVNIALLSGYLSWQVIRLASERGRGIAPWMVATAVPPGKPKTAKKSSRARGGFPAPLVLGSLAGIAMFFLVFFPNLNKAVAMVTPEEAPYSPTDAWMASLTWMRENTPEPFGDPAAYYEIFPKPAKGEKFDYPDSAYGVTSWWDYGYWITQIAHRMPSANPSQLASRIINVADLFLSTDDQAARDMMANMGSAYVVIDYLTARSKYWAVVTWAGQPQGKYYDVFIAQIEGKLQAVQVYYPAYYRSLVVRLYNFDGQAVTDVKPTVIKWVDAKDSLGTPYKQIVEAQDFTSYQDALDYINSQESGNYTVVGTSPFLSPVPLEEVPDFRLVHASEQGVTLKGVGFIPEVKIFEYTGRNK